jgi:raffinose/stachyose/melibiose transport system substrate-binding protein
MKKISLILLAAAMSVTAFTGCSSKSKDTPVGDTKTEAKTVKIFQLKVEIADQLNKLAEDYKKETGVNLKVETVGGGQDYGAGLMAKFAGGDAPDIFNTQGFADFDRFFDKIEDLSGEPWAKNIVKGTDDGVVKDGKLYGQPEAIEGFGFAYNKDLFLKAGITEVPKTYTQLEEVCKKLQAAGITPFSNSYAEWWALGIHNINVLFAQQSEPAKLVPGLIDGSIMLKDNPGTKDWLKLVDLTVKYGQKNSFQAGDYKSSVTDFAAGKAAMIQQGVWIQPDLDKVDPSLKLGFIPMLTSDDAAKNYTYYGVPQWWHVNKNSKVKKEAKDFLNWLVTSEIGSKYIVKEFKFLPAVTSVKSTEMGQLNAALNDSIKANVGFSWNYQKSMPNGSSQDTGNAMMKYIAGQISKDQLLDEIQKSIVDKAKK